MDGVLVSVGKGQKESDSQSGRDSKFPWAAQQVSGLAVLAGTHPVPTHKRPAALWVKAGKETGLTASAPNSQPTSPIIKPEETTQQSTNCPAQMAQWIGLVKQPRAN